jgi:plastocyanin
MAASGKSTSTSSPAASLAGQIKTAMLKVLADAKGVITAKDMPAAAPFIGEAVSLTAQIKNGPTANVTQLVQALGLNLPVGPSLSTTSQPAGAQAATVILKDFVYSPRVLTVRKGATVTFRNLDTVKHTVTSDSGLFDSGDLDTGQSFTHTFNQAGTFPYYCVFHGDKGGVDMAGVIQVEP